MYASRLRLANFAVESVHTDAPDAKAATADLNYLVQDAGRPALAGLPIPAQWFIRRVFIRRVFIRGLFRPMIIRPVFIGRLLIRRMFSDSPRTRADSPGAARLDSPDS